MNIKELAEQAGFEYSSQWEYWTAYENDLKRFAELVAAAERESCAKVCENLAYRSQPGATVCAAAIRGRQA